MSFRQLPHAARVYLELSVALAAVLLAAALAIHPVRPGGAFALLLVLGIAAAAAQVDLPIARVQMTLSNAVVFLAVMTEPYPTHAALIAAAAGALGPLLSRPRDAEGRRMPLVWYRSAFSAANLTKSALASGYLWYWICPGPLSTHTGSRFLAGLLALSTAYFATNTLGVSLAVALARKLPALRVWRESFLWTYPGYLYMVSAAAGVSLAYNHLNLGALLLIPPLFLAYGSYRVYLGRINAELRRVQELNDLNERLIGTLAMSIEAKDRYAQKHVDRVRAYALAVAQELGITGAELDAVRIASLLHDVGKIAVPELILTRPGKLSPEEFERMKTHVPVGVKILEAVGFPFPVAEAVGAHHEHWDGTGYPKGLKGEEIPLAGRIVALADGFDALTSDRPYRHRLEDEEAVNLLREQRGRRYDPRVVDALLRILPRVLSMVREMGHPDWQPDLAMAHRPVPQEALDEIARAAEESVVLAEMFLRPSASRDPKEAIELTLEKAMRLVPASAAAVFMLDAEAGEVRVRGSRGLYGSLLKDLSVKLGEGVSGRAAAHGLSVLSIPAAGDLARRVEPGQALELNSALSVPLQVGDACIGALTVYHTRPSLYTEHHQRLLTTLGEHAASALDTLLKLQTNQVLAYTDSLTGLPNMRYLIDHLEHLTTDMAAPFSVLLLDLDGFKRVNDTLGHLAGDRVLVEIAGILRGCLRENDVVGRYAGDEFVIVCQSPDVHHASLIADRTRQGLETYLPAEAYPGRLSTSLGIAAFPTDGKDWRALLSAADRRMYQDKLSRHSTRDSGEDAPRDVALAAASHSHSRVPV